MSNKGNFTVDPKKPLVLGVVGGLAGIYLVPINPILGPIFAALGAVAAIIWGAEVVARVGSYGLGTGIPSIGYMALAIAIIGVLGGLSGSVFLGNIVWMGPLIGFILSMIVGGIAAILVTRVLKLKVPILLRCTVELSGASALSVLGFAAAIAGSYTLPVILEKVVYTGFIALLFILNTMIISHPFNACFGPQENRRTTLKLASATGFMAMAIIGVLGIGLNQAWWLITLVGAIGWFISIRAFIRASKEGAASVKWSGWWPKEEEY